MGREFKSTSGPRDPADPTTGAANGCTQLRAVETFGYGCSAGELCSSSSCSFSPPRAHCFPNHGAIRRHLEDMTDKVSLSSMSSRVAHLLTIYLYSIQTSWRLWARWSIGLCFPDPTLSPKRRTSRDPMTLCLDYWAPNTSPPS
jgi:hypothetical protein